MYPEILTQLRLHRDDTEVVKVALAAIAALLPIGFYLWHRYAEPRADALARRLHRGLKATLALLVVASVANYARLDPRYVFVERVDTYDLCHYYLNAKYFDELGYFGLYPAIVLADMEEGPRYKRQTPYFQAQNEDDYYFVDFGAFAQDAAWHGRIRAAFGEAGWLQFKHDFITLQRGMTGFSQSTWSQMLVDHGFNGAPSWVLLAQPLAEAVPVEWVKALGYLDVLWLAVAVGVTAWAFGGVTAQLLVVFLLTSYSTRWPTLSWAFGRYDYVSLLIIAVGLVKKGRYAWGGAAVGMSTAFRIFPAVWLWGPAFKGAWQLLVERRLNRRLVTLAAGFFGMLLALNAGVAARYGPEAVETHFENLFAHTTPENLSSMRQGFAIAVAYQGETDIKRMDDVRRLRVKEQARWRTPLAVFLVLLLGLGLRRAKDHEALAMGFVPFFLLATASYYYYVVRATLVAMHGGDLRKLRNALGLSFLFAIEVTLNALQQHPATERFRVIHMGWLGWLCAAYSVGMIGWFLWESRKRPDTPDGGSA
ncbi:MAG: hypothetical protein H6739_24730 [Alphaproteobacteria bacterium]|nr:hypothetical protein [Alphaproteobacteria bacterium]